MKQKLDTLIEIHRNIKINYPCIEAYYSAFESNKRLLMTLSAMGNSILTLYDMNRKCFLLKSTRFKELLGYTDPRDLENEDIEKFYTVIHPDDLPFVLDTDIKAHKFLETLPALEKKNYKLIYDFRIKNIHGNYLRFLHQLVLFETDKLGKEWLALIITDLLSEQETDEAPQRRMLNMKTGKLCLFNDNTEVKSDQVLTDREKKILTLISQGLDSAAISKRLFISVNTVNNHRQNILSKTKTENTAQALLYAKRLGIL